MHQKLQFAVTVINDPELLILDEPFSGLDPLNTDLLKDIILEMKEQGKTIIFSTHVMHEAEKLCDFILLINKGKAGGRRLNLQHHQGNPEPDDAHYDGLYTAIAGLVQTCPGPGWNTRAGTVVCAPFDANGNDTAPVRWF